MNPAESPRDWAAARFVEVLGQVLEAMTEVAPRLSWQPAGRPAAAPESETLWWEQPLTGIAGAGLWVGAPSGTWQHAGALALKAAGLETIDAGEARSTWIEILNQALSAVARAIGGVAGSEVTCEAGAEHFPAQEVQDWASVSLAFEDTSLPPLLVGVSAGVVAALASPQNDVAVSNVPAVKPPGEDATPVKSSRTMDLLLDVELPVSISFGKTCLPLRDVLKLTTGSIVELNRTASEPVEVLVNQRLVARGEVVVVEGNYGVRIQEIASHRDRLRSIP